MLKWFGRIEDVAFFQIPHTLILQIQLIPMSFMIAVFPVFSRLMHSDYGKMADIYEKVFRFMLAGSLFVGISLLLFSSEVIHLVFGAKYAASAASLRIVSFAVCPLIMDMFLNGVLIAMDKQKYSVIYAGAVLVLNFLAALLFIPRYGFIAAAWISVFSYVFVFLCSLYFVEKNGLSVRLMNTALKALASVLVCTATVLLLKPFSLAASLAAGTMVYVCAVIFMRVITVNELLSLKNIVSAARVQGGYSRS